MDKKTMKILGAIYKMGPTERNELLEQLKQYESGSLPLKKSMNESILKSLNFGPLDSSTCPVCGK